MYNKFITLTEVYLNNKREVYINVSHIRVLNRSPDMQSTRIRFSSDPKDSIDVEETLTEVMTLINEDTSSE